MPAKLFVRVTSQRTRYTVALVDTDGKERFRCYDGDSQQAKFCAVRYLRKLGFCEGWCDPCAVSTSGGGGVKIGMYEREHIAALRGGKV